MRCSFSQCDCFAGHAPFDGFQDYIKVNGGILCYSFILRHLESGTRLGWPDRPACGKRCGKSGPDSIGSPGLRAKGLRCLPWNDPQYIEKRQLICIHREVTMANLTFVVLWLPKHICTVLQHGPYSTGPRTCLFVGTRPLTTRYLGSIKRVSQQRVIL